MMLLDYSMNEFNLPSCATSARIPPPPTSKMILLGVALQAQNSNVPFPLPILVSFPFTHTGISGKSLIKHCEPFNGFILRLIDSSQDCKVFADNLAPCFTLRPYSPNANVVPAVLPPVGQPTLPL